MTELVSDLLDDVRGFLKGLSVELPELFPAGRRTGRRVPFQGRELALIVEDRPLERLSGVQEREDGLLLVRGADGAKPREALRAWYRMKASALFSERAAHFAAAMGVAYKRIFIKDQRTLWGSCSQAGNLNFNWRVVLAPAAVLDYLVVHELAHLLEMNHSRRFWAHVERQCPDYRVHRRWLRDNARDLKRA